MSISITGIVASSRPGSVLVQLPDSTVSALSKHEPSSLVVGDHVRLRQEGEYAEVQEVLPRTNNLLRLRGDRTHHSGRLEEHVLAANLDVAVIVAAVSNPPFHPRFIDRYLVAIQYGKIRPLICLSKCDLPHEPHPILADYQKANLTVIATSTKTGQGLDSLRNELHNRTAVLVGMSGTGKSSLINALTPHAALRTGSVSKHTHKGQHTTSTSSLHIWDPHSYIIDTPGIRSLGLEHIPKEQLADLFPEFSEYSNNCRFRNCLHHQEPGCALRQAVEQGTLSPARYHSYLRLLSA